MPINLDSSITLASTSIECKLMDGTVCLTDIIEDEIKIDEPEAGKITLLGYNQNRANSIIAIRFNGKEFTIKSDSNGNYKQTFDLVPDDNIIEVKMMNNIYKEVLAKSYKMGPRNKFVCTLVDSGKHILLTGKHSLKKSGERVEISYMGHNKIYITTVEGGTFSKKVPVLDKENIFQLLITKDSSLSCPPVLSNKSLADSIDTRVKNMTATICLGNEDRKSGDTVTYTYNGKEISRTLEMINNKTCFKMPLDYTKIHDFKIKQLDGTYRNEQIITELRRDFVRIRITFNNCSSDIDLFVLEPKNADGSSNSLVYHGNKKNYGKLDTDSHKASEGPENYSIDLANATKGKYYYWVNWYAREANFKAYAKKECDVRLDIIDQGVKSVKSLRFMPVTYTTNKDKQLKQSSYPGYGFKEIVNKKTKLNHNTIHKNAFSFEIQ